MARAALTGGTSSKEEQHAVVPDKTHEVWKRHAQNCVSHYSISDTKKRNKEHLGMVWGRTGACWDGDRANFQASSRLSKQIFIKLGQDQNQSREAGLQNP